jgi:hypothetical protein
VLEKIKLDDLREEFESEKSESELRERRKFDTHNLQMARRIVFILADKSRKEGDAFDLMLTHPEPVMSDDAYFDLFNNDS